MLRANPPYHEVRGVFPPKFGCLVDRFWIEKGASGAQGPRTQRFLPREGHLTPRERGPLPVPASGGRSAGPFPTIPSRPQGEKRHPVERPGPCGRACGKFRVHPPFSWPLSRPGSRLAAKRGCPRAERAVGKSPFRFRLPAFRHRWRNRSRLMPVPVGFGASPVAAPAGPAPALSGGCVPPRGPWGGRTTDRKRRREGRHVSPPSGSARFSRTARVSDPRGPDPRPLAGTLFHLLSRGGETGRDAAGAGPIGTGQPKPTFPRAPGSGLAPGPAARRPPDGVDTVSGTSMYRANHLRAGSFAQVKKQVIMPFLVYKTLSLTH